MKKRIIIVIISLILFNLILIFSPTNNYITSVYNNISTGFQNLGTEFVSFKDRFKAPWELEKQIKKLEEENEELKHNNSELEKKNEVLKGKNEDYQKTLDLKSTSSTSKLMANVLYRKINSPFDIFVIDRGSEDGVKENQIVSYNSQMIGYITDVKKYQSEFLLLANDNIRFNIPIKIKTEEKEVNGIIESYSLSKNKLNVKTLFEGDIGEVGDKVYTNGYGENQLNNIYVGEITEVEDKDADKTYYVSVNEENFEYVEVITNEN